jgi:thiosulfate reductase cytochrome b subunit
LLRDFGNALRFRLPHRLGQYNAVQRLLYTAVILCICVQVLTGLAVHLLLVAIYPRTLVSMVASTKAEEEQ